MGQSPRSAAERSAGADRALQLHHYVVRRIAVQMYLTAHAVRLQAPLFEDHVKSLPGVSDVGGRTMVDDTRTVAFLRQIHHSVSPRTPTKTRTAIHRPAMPSDGASTNQTAR